MTRAARTPDRAELAAMLYAARTVAQPRSSSRLATALAAALLCGTALFAQNLADFPHNDDARPFLIGREHELSSRRGAEPDEEIDMRRLKEVAVASTLALTTAASAQNAVQWRVQDGGNGHWYASRIVSNDISWEEAKLACEAEGGHLATLTTPAEDNFVWQLAAQPACWVVVNQPGWTGAKGPWLGLRQAPSSATTQGWGWITGEPFTWAHPSFAPNDGCSVDENRLNYIGPVPSTRTWNDFPGDVPCPGWGFPRSYIIEWSADCNNDGLVDYGQILAGQLADTNQNGVPDTCEVDPCPGDITGNNSVDGVDLAALLAAWGGGKSQYDCDVDNDGLVGGSDLAVVLAGWGACP